MCNFFEQCATINFQILDATFSSKSNRFLHIKGKIGVSRELYLNKRHSKKVTYTHRKIYL